MRGADDAAGDGVVVADDRVLDGVRERQQHDQVERIELSELALAGQSQADDQEDVDQDRADDLFEDGDAEDEDVGPDLVVHGFAGLIAFGPVVGGGAVGMRLIYHWGKRVNNCDRASAECWQCNGRVVAGGGRRL